MKTGRTLGDLAAEIDRQAKAKQDFIAPTPKLTLIAGLAPQTMDLMVENSGLFPVRDLALSQIGERTGVLSALLRCRRDSESPAFSYCLRQLCGSGRSAELIGVVQPIALGCDTTA